LLGDSNATTVKAVPKWLEERRKKGN